LLVWAGVEAGKVLGVGMLAYSYLVMEVIVDFVVAQVFGVCRSRVNVWSKNRIRDSMWSSLPSIMWRED